MKALAFPFVISTEAQRSGEIRVFSGLSWKMFFFHSSKATG
jgi:hypothetical protein